MTPRQPGDDTDAAYTRGSPAAAETSRAVQDAVARAHAARRGTLADSGGAYFAPAVLTRVTPDCGVQGELFGPVAVV